MRVSGSIGGLAGQRTSSSIPGNGARGRGGGSRGRGRGRHGFGLHHSGEGSRNFGSHGQQLQSVQVMELQEEINRLQDRNATLERTVQEERSHRERLRDSLTQERDGLKLSSKLASHQATHLAEDLSKSYIALAYKEAQNSELTQQLAEAKQEAEEVRAELRGARDGLTFVRRMLAETREEFREQGEALKEAQEARAADQARIDSLELGKKLAADQAAHFHDKLMESYATIGKHTLREQRDVHLMGEVVKAANEAAMAYGAELAAALEEARTAKEACRELEEDCRWHAQRLDRADDIQEEQKATIRKLKAKVQTLEEGHKATSLSVRLSKRREQGLKGFLEGSPVSSPIAAVHDHRRGTAAQDHQDLFKGSPTWRLGFEACDDAPAGYLVEDKQPQAPSSANLPDTRYCICGTTNLTLNAALLQTTNNASMYVARSNREWPPCDCNSQSSTTCFQTRLCPSSCGDCCNASYSANNPACCPAAPKWYPNCSQNRTTPATSTSSSTSSSSGWGSCDPCSATGGCFNKFSCPATSANVINSLAGISIPLNIG